MSGGPSECGESAGVVSHSRRLAAIAFADIVGYSILMAEDETRTLERWMAVLGQIVRPLTAQHRGILVKSTGDGVLAEFPEALDAIAWARELQRRMRASREAPGASPAAPIAFRIALHFGDVIAADGDIYGIGVNLAARLQEHAAPGGIILSEAMYDLVRGIADIAPRDLGYLNLRKIEQPVRAYALDTEDTGVSVPRRSRPEGLPSIAVLPLHNLDGTPDNDYLADGLVEDIVVSLAGLRELMVISRSSTLMFRGRQADPRDVGHALGVGYVLTGSVRRSPRLVRVSVQLCDALTGASLWGETQAVPPGELFDVQDRIVERIVAGIAPNVRAAELERARRKKPSSFTAYDYTLKALNIINSLDLNTFLQADEYLRLAMAEDNEFAMPVAWSARWHSLRIGQGWSDNPTADASRAAELATRAIELDPQNALALATHGHLKSFLFHDYASALVYFDRALAACPNSALAWILSSATLSYVGRSEEAIRHAKHGLRLSPCDQSLFYYYNFLGLAHYAHGAYEEAASWCRLSAGENAHYTANLRILAAALAALDRVGEAREVVQHLVLLEPHFRLGDYQQTRQPFQHPDIKARYIEHLARAGIPP